MTIPKVIYQTWKTVELSPNLKLIRDRIEALNPDYATYLYDDEAIDSFIQVNFTERIYRAFSKLKNGAARADFWRYCVLYKNGGIYLDIDSEIVRPLNELIDFENDQCIITREGNPGIFNNWIMIFEKEHPILERAIELCCLNIEQKVKPDKINICYLTGPAGPFTSAINDILLPFLYQGINQYCAHLYFLEDELLNFILNNPGCVVKARFYGTDMGTFAKCKHEFSNELYQTQLHWTIDKCVFNTILNLEFFEQKIFSQNGEDGITMKLVEQLYGEKNKYKFYVEFGVQDGIECNTRILWEKYQWLGLQMDGDHENDGINLRKEYFTKDNLLNLFQKYNIPKHIHLLSVDIDFNVFYCLKEILTTYTCDIIICEYNSTHLPHEDKIVVYDQNGKWDGTNYFGVSLLSLDKLAKMYNYSIVYCDKKGVNCFMVHNDIIKQKGLEFKHIGNLDKIYRPPRYGNGPNGGHQADLKNRPYITFDEAICI
jgi:hypothetical protein